ncbi:hypothetical protein QVA66_03490 [Staphylococcus chromogenes]|nr:hypothetical protein [Staphylococcus chromogenes]
MKKRLWICGCSTVLLSSLVAINPAPSVATTAQPEVMNQNGVEQSAGVLTVTDRSTAVVELAQGVQVKDTGESVILIDKRMGASEQLPRRGTDKAGNPVVLSYERTADSSDLIVRATAASERSVGECVTGAAGNAITGAGTVGAAGAAAGATVGAAGGTVALPVVGTVAGAGGVGLVGGVGGAIVGALGGGLTGASDHCFG